MYSAAQTNRNRFAKPVAFGLALLALIFFLQIAGHGHKDSRQDSACRICQLAHMGLGPAVVAVILTTPLIAVGQMSTLVGRFQTQDLSSQSSPRAPPTPEA